MIGPVPFLALEAYKFVNLAGAVPRMTRITDMAAVFREKKNSMLLCCAS